MDLGSAGQPLIVTGAAAGIVVETVDLLLDEGAWAVEDSALPEIGTR
jgi:hypothetical protein